MKACPITTILYITSTFIVQGALTRSENLVSFLTFYCVCIIIAFEH